MFRCVFLKLKDICKLIIIVLIIIMIFLFCKNIYLKFISENSIEIFKYINPNIASIENTNEDVLENLDDYNNKNYMEKFIESEILAINVINNSASQTEDNTVETAMEQDTSEIEEIPKEAKTEIITENPIEESYNTEYGSVKIKNQTEYTLTQEMLTPNIEISNKNILIFHTHSCESYTPSEQYNYAQTGNFRTTDLNFTVTRVGTELENLLKEKSINVYHDSSYHDYPAYNGSYTRSLETVNNILGNFQSDIIIDLHRDAIGSRSDYAPKVKIGDDIAAQIMFVIGTNNGGLWHPDWNQNLKFAIKIQEKANEMYPGLFKPIMLTKSRYNQHTGKYANIMEVGSTGNKLEECINSMKYLSNVISEVLKN